MALRAALVCHPETPCDAIAQIAVDVERKADDIVVRYEAQGRIGDVLVPARSASARADGLWQHTCFEAFIGAENGARYCEFNFSPSTEWAAYRFDGYRSGMGPMEDVAAVPILFEASETSLLLQATLPRAALTQWLGGGPLRLGLSAVIEETSGRKSYWALRHPPGKPDFHHADCFVLSLDASLLSS